MTRSSVFPGFGHFRFDSIRFDAARPPLGLNLRPRIFPRTAGRGGDWRSARVTSTSTRPCPVPWTSGLCRLVTRRHAPPGLPGLAGLARLPPAAGSHTRHEHADARAARTAHATQHSALSPERAALVGSGNADFHPGLRCRRPVPARPVQSCQASGRIIATRLGLARRR